MNNIKCNVEQPIEFSPSSALQDIAIMTTIFDRFEYSMHIFEMQLHSSMEDQNSVSTDLEMKYELKIKHYDQCTLNFYLYHSSEPWISKGEQWQTLARWRYQNDDRYKEFQYWCFLNNIEWL